MWKKLQCRRLHRQLRLEDIYTIKDGEVVHTLMGWERHYYFLCTNGTLANVASGGASLYGTRYYTYTGQMITAETTDGLIESVTYDGDRDANNPWFYCTTKGYNLSIRIKSF